tara:strand:+ start:4200 stop:6611 length:2412 start_codon:yes stop_codon:yes gene_type:complete
VYNVALELAILTFITMKKSGRLFLYLSACVALIDVLFVVMNYHLSEHSFEQNMEAESESLYLNYQTLLSQTYNNLLTIATFVSSDPKIQQLFNKGRAAVELEGGGSGGEQAQKYRNALYELVGDKWKAVQNKFSARQLHFHLGPGSTSFLRVHKPEKFGDNMDNVRFTIVDTNHHQVPVTGFETGRVYSGLRGVVPITAIDPISGNEIHVGALEIGTSFDVILNILQDTSNYAAGVLLTKEHIKSAMWPEAIEKKFGGQQIECECVIEASSADNFKDIIAEGKAQGVRFRDGGHKIVTVGENSFLVSYFPLRDYRGSLIPEREDVGAIVFWKNVDEPLAKLRTSQLYNILYGIVGFIIVELLFLFAFKLATRSLEDVIRKKTHQLRVNKDRLSEAQCIASVGNWEWNVKSGELWWSDQIYKLFELDPAVVKPDFDTFLSFIHPEDLQHVQNEINRALSTKGHYAVSHRVVLPSQREIQVLANARLELDELGEPAVMKGTVQDVSVQRAVEQRLSDVIWATGVGVWEWDVQNDTLHINDRWAEMAGYSVSELAPLSHHSWEILIYPQDLPLFREAFEHVGSSQGAIIHTEVRVRHRDGHWVWVLIKGRCVEKGTDGHSRRVSGSCADITERKVNEKKIRRLATFDTLTGVFNRAIFNEKLDEAFSLSGRTQQPFTLMMLDLDGFKGINDHYGHPTGDALLRLVAADLKNECRESDLVARLGGDEFALILLSTNDKEGSKAFAHRLLAKISQERLIDGHMIKANASIGCCLYSPSTSSAEEMIKNADIALYSAKQQGKNTVKCCC